MAMHNALHIKSLLKPMGIYKSLCVALTSYTVFENKGRCWNLCLRFLVQKLGTCSNEYTLIKGYSCKISSSDLTILLMSFYTTNFLTWFTHKVGVIMMTSSNGNIFRVTGPLCGEFPTQRPVTRSFDFSLIYAWIHGWVNNREAGDVRRHRAHYDVIVMDVEISWCSWWVNIKI